MIYYLEVCAFYLPNSTGGKPHIHVLSVGREAVLSWHHWSDLILEEFVCLLKDLIRETCSYLANRFIDFHIAVVGS